MLYLGRHYQATHEEGQRGTNTTGYLPGISVTIENYRDYIRGVECECYDSGATKSVARVEDLALASLALHQWAQCGSKQDIVRSVTAHGKREVTGYIAGLLPIVQLEAKKIFELEQDGSILFRVTQSLRKQLISIAGVVAAILAAHQYGEQIMDTLMTFIHLIHKLWGNE